MKLFFDCETTGLPNFNARARDPSQPHLVQAAFLVADDDGSVTEHCSLVRPDGWRIPDEVVAIHKISQERAEKDGISEQQVTEDFFGLARRAQMTVAHNHMFDKFIFRIAGRRYGLMSDADDAWWKALPMFCTMKAMTNVCEIPPTEAMVASGRNWFKSPNLAEAYRHATGQTLSGAHDALADVRACKAVYDWIHQKPVAV